MFPRLALTSSAWTTRTRTISVATWWTAIPIASPGRPALIAARLAILR
jgi:hypothetical protein